MDCTVWAVQLNRVIVMTSPVRLTATGAAGARGLFAANHAESENVLDIDIVIRPSPVTAE